jgi:hypothetical protein
MLHEAIRNFLAVYGALVLLFHVNRAIDWIAEKRITAIHAEIEKIE